MLCNLFWFQGFRFAHYSHQWCRHCYNSFVSFQFQGLKVVKKDCWWVVESKDWFTKLRRFPNSKLRICGKNNKMQQCNLQHPPSKPPNFKYKLFFIVLYLCQMHNSTLYLRWILVSKFYLVIISTMIANINKMKGFTLPNVHILLQI